MNPDRIKPFIGNHLEECNDFPLLAKECKAEDDVIAYRRFSGICIQEEDLSGISFEHVIFENCRMVHCSFSGGNFTDVIFRSCELSNCDFSSSYFLRTEIQAVKGIGANFNEARLIHVKIADSNFSYANFNEVRMDRFSALQSDFSEAFLTASRLKDTSVHEVCFNKANFYRTSLKGIDLTTCRISGIVISMEARELKGAVVNMFQAVELAKLLGVVVR